MNNNTMNGKDIQRGDFMDCEQILLLIINNRLFEDGEITKEEMDKISTCIKSEEFAENC